MHSLSRYVWLDNLDLNKAAHTYKAVVPPTQLQHLEFWFLVHLCVTAIRTLTFL